VTVEGDEATLRFPTLVAPTYRDQRPDPARVADGRLGIDNWFTVRFDDSALTPAVPSHDTHGTPGSVDLSDIALDRDIIVRWEVAESISEARWLPDDDDPESGTIEVVVRTNDTEGGSSPVDVVRPVDRSGSISGWGEQAAQDLSVSVVEALRPDDTVTVIAFDSKRGTLALDARRVRLPLGSPTTVRRSAGRHRRDHRWRLDHWPMTSASRCCSRSAGCTGTCCDREGAPGSEAARRHQLVTVQYSERSPTCCTHGA